MSCTYLESFSLLLLFKVPPQDFFRFDLLIFYGHQYVSCRSKNILVIISIIETLNIDQRQLIAVFDVVCSFGDKIIIQSKNNLNWPFYFRLLIKIDTDNLIMSQNFFPLKKRASSSILPSHHKSSSAHSPSRNQKETNLFNGLYKGNKIDPQSQTTSQPQPLLYRNLPPDVQQLLKGKSEILVRGKSSKTVQQLLQENIYIKGVNNKLREEIMILRGQINVKTKRSSLINPSTNQANTNKNIEISYQKDIYWLNNEKSYRLEGIKSQYEKLKRQYEKNIKELKNIKIQLAETGKAEQQIYIKQLQSQNKMLVDCIKKMSNSDGKNGKNIKTNQQNQEIQNQIAIKLKEQILRLKQKIRQKDYQIVFMERSLIGKDNAERSANCKVRKYKKQYQQVVGSQTKLKQQLQTAKNRLQIQKIKMKSYFTEEINQCRRQSEKVINQKDHRIKQLEQSVKNMSIAANKNNSGLTKSLTGQNRSNIRKMSHDHHHLKLLIPQQNENDFQLTQSRRYASHPHHQNSSNFNSQNSEILSKPDIREPRRANMKHSQDCKKMRKVEYNDVQYLGQLIRYRLIGQRVDPSQIKDYFIRKEFYTEQSQREQSKKSRSFFQVIEQVDKQSQKGSKQWQDEYIAMRQVVQILSSAPFSLNSEQSYLLGRYLVEDCDDDYVFCSQDNENKRQIVKSIIKTLVGGYEVPTEQQVQNLQKVLAKYKANLKSTLDNYYPSGIIPKNKLIQTLIGIGMEPSQRDKQILVGKASLASQNLAELHYLNIFQL